MARQPKPEDAVRMRRVKASLEISDQTAQEIAKSIFGSDTTFRITGGTVFLEHLIPASAEDLVARTAAAEERMMQIGKIRTLTSGYTMVSEEDLPPPVGEVDLVDTEDKA